MADIFLSYADEDHAVARTFVALFESAGRTVWWDRRIPAGKTWRVVLDDAPAQMRCLVVLWSRHSINSPWVLEEAEEARSGGTLLPVLIDAVVPPRGFREIHAVDFQRWDGSPSADCARSLVDDINAMIGPPSTGGDAETARPPAVRRVLEAGSDAPFATRALRVDSPAPEAPVLARETPSAAPCAPPPARDARTSASDPGASARDSSTLTRAGSTPASVAPPVVPAPAKTRDQHTGDTERPVTVHEWSAPVRHPAAWPGFLPWLLLGVVLIAVAGYFALRPRPTITPANPPDPVVTVPSTVEPGPRSAPGTQLGPGATAEPAPSKHPDPALRIPTRPGTANPERSAAPVAPKSARPARCGDILARAQLGETLTTEERSFLQQECR